MFPSLDTKQLNPCSDVLHRDSCLLAFTCLAWPTEIVISTCLKHSLNLQKDLCNKFLQTMHMVYKVKLLISSNYKSWRTIQIHNNRNYNIALTRILWFWERFLRFSTRRTHVVAFIMRMVLYILQTLAKVLFTGTYLCSVTNH